MIWESLLRHSANNWNKGPDNCKSVSDPSQTYMVDTPMDPKNGKTRPRLQKWAGLGGDQNRAFSQFDCQREVQRRLCYKRFSKIFYSKKVFFDHLTSIFHINRDFQISISHEKISILAKNEFFLLKWTYLMKN